MAHRRFVAGRIARAQLEQAPALLSDEDGLGEGAVRGHRHLFAVDFQARTRFGAAGNDEDVRAVISGNVILTGNSPESGYYIVIQAENQLVYILKNNSQLLKKTGNFVNSGEILAKAGKNNSAKTYISTLELWYRGQAIDATKFIK